MRRRPGQPRPIPRRLLEPAYVAAQVGQWSTDISVGWEAGLRGKERIGGKSFDRWPPEHFHGPRFLAWDRGYQAGLRFRAQRKVYWSVRTETGEISGKGSWGLKRGAIASRIETLGVRLLSDIVFDYVEGDGQIMKTIHVMI